MVDLDVNPQFDDKGWLTTPPQTPQDMINQDFAAIYGIPDKTFMEQQAVVAIQNAMPFQSVLNDRSLPQLGPEDPDTAPVGPNKGMPPSVMQFNAIDAEHDQATTAVNSLAPMSFADALSATLSAMNPAMTSPDDTSTSPDQGSPDDGTNAGPDGGTASGNVGGMATGGGPASTGEDGGGNEGGGGEGGGSAGPGAGPGGGGSGGAGEGGEGGEGGE